ncbi:MAG: hypothetical protein ACE5LU_11135 [Anaerolineae bacterium]
MSLRNSHRLPIDTLTTPLGKSLRAVGRRLRLRDGLLFATGTLWLALVGTGIVLFAGRFWPIEHLGRWAGVPPLIWLIAVLGYAVFRPLPLPTVARRADVMLKLKERLSTALELAMQGAQAPSRARRGSKLVERQWNDAMAVARQINPRRDIRLAVDRQALRWAGVAVAAVLTLAIMPNPMDAVLEHRAAVREAAQDQAKQVEELREELRGETTPTSEEREELLRQLAELARKLRQNPGIEEKALADISAAEEALRRQLDPQASAKRAALQSLATQLTQLANQPSNHPAIQPTNSPHETLDQLAEALASMSPTQQAGLAQQLDQLAAQAAATDADLASALSALADAARRGDAQAGERAAQSAQAALTNAQRDQDLQRAIARALAELQNSREAVARAGQSGQGDKGTRGQGDKGTRGQGDKGTRRQGSGQGQGQGSGQGQGQPGGGGGTNARQLPPGSRTGRAGDPTGPARRPDVGELDEVYAPFTPGGAGDIDFIRGQQSGEGQTQVRQERQPWPGSAGRATVPYTEVFPAYREAAGAALEREYIPPGLREYVKEYFSRLDPEGGQ